MVGKRDLLVEDPGCLVWRLSVHLCEKYMSLFICIRWQIQILHQIITADMGVVRSLLWFTGCSETRQKYYLFKCNHKNKVSLKSGNNTWCLWSTTHDTFCWWPQTRRFKENCSDLMTLHRLYIEKRLLSLALQLLFVFTWCFLCLFLHLFCPSLCLHRFFTFICASLQMQGVVKVDSDSEQTFLEGALAEVPSPAPTEPQTPMDADKASIYR